VHYKFCCDDDDDNEVNLLSSTKETISAINEAANTNEATKIKNKTNLGQQTQKRKLKLNR